MTKLPAKYPEIVWPVTYQICKIVATLSCHQTVREAETDHILHIGMEARGVGFQHHIN